MYPVVGSLGERYNRVFKGVDGDPCDFGPWFGSVSLLGFGS